MKSYGGSSESQGPVPSSFCIPFPTLSLARHLHHHRLLAFPLPLLRGRPVALIIREYVAVMLSIPPANSNRAHPPTWLYRQEKWPHALQSQHFCVGCGRERGSSPRTRGSEREREIERAPLRVPRRDFPACERSATSCRRFTLVFIGASQPQSFQVRDPTKRCPRPPGAVRAGSPPKVRRDDKQCIEWLVYQ